MCTSGVKILSYVIMAVSNSYVYIYAIFLTNIPPIFQLCQLKMSFIQHLSLFHYRILSSCQVSLAFYNLEYFHSLSLSFMIIIFLKNTTLYLSIESYPFGVLWYFLMIRLRLHTLLEYHIWRHGIHILLIGDGNFDHSIRCHQYFQYILIYFSPFEWIFSVGETLKNHVNILFSSKLLLGFNIHW